MLSNMFAVSRIALSTKTVFGSRRLICCTGLNLAQARKFQAKERSTKFVNKSRTDEDSDDFEIPAYDKAMDRKNDFRAIMSNLAIRNRREKLNLIALEGQRMINDAIASGLKIKNIYFTMKEHLKDINNLEELVQVQRTRFSKILHRDMKTFSTLTTPTSIVAIAERPSLEHIQAYIDHSNELPLIVICDNVRDPGNLGTILRTSAGAGVLKVLLTSGCVDAWNSKVLKAGSGAHFKLPIHAELSPEDILKHLPSEFDVYIAESKKSPLLSSSSTIEQTKYYDVNFFNNKQETKVLILGNEGFGVSGESYQLAQQHNGCSVQIPLYKNVESLNTAIASSILIYEIRKQFDLLK